MANKIVLLPGWANLKVCVNKLYLSLDAIYNDNRFYFDYSYNVPDDDIETEKGIYAPFEVMQQRFYDFLSSNKLLNDKIDIIGYSEGGIIAIYSAGQHDDIIVDRYISIDSPHGGAYKENFIWLDGGVTEEFEAKSNFMKKGGEYEAKADVFFKKYRDNKLLQIYSNEDIVATTKSALRFKDYMDTFEVTEGNKWHLAIPNNPTVISKVGSYLS